MYRICDTNSDFSVVVIGARLCSTFMFISPMSPRICTISFNVAQDTPYSYKHMKIGSCAGDVGQKGEKMRRSSSFLQTGKT